MTNNAADSKYLFNDLMDVRDLLPDYQKAYSALSRIFNRCINDTLSDAKVNFSGTFAKVDYILKKYNATKAQSLRINDTRVRLRKRVDLSAQVLNLHFEHDFKAVAEFIALAFSASVPVEIKAFFPADKECRQPSRHRIAEYLRAIVNSVDENYIYCHADDYNQGEILKIDYARRNKAFPGDWSYLRNMLAPGMQINIIRPNSRGDDILPELIIVDPDQLINISTIASCFATYAESHLVDLINRLKPQVNSHAIVLGNFAGQLLDEAIHQSDNSYSVSAKDFYKNNALKMLDAHVDSDKFHKEAREQRVNIETAINTALPWTLATNFDSKEGIVEPSFISEMLGLQGRMDFLQLDFKVLLEQKSGKGISSKDDTFIRPTHRTEHYVQLLLYMLIIRYNFSEIYRQNSERLNAFLLYSKYKEPLVGLGFSPDLIFRALKIRNALAWANIEYANADGMRLLERLTPDSLNKNRFSGPFWENYIKPQLECLLDPIHQASDLERDYYFRFLSFISCEFMMSKVGYPGRECSGFASTWLESLDDKRSAGNIFDNLVLIVPTSGSKNRVESVKFRFSETEQHDMSNFRKGDIVILYPYHPGKEPDARTTIIFRGTIETIEVDTLSVALRASQSDARVFDHYAGMSWAIEHDFMESSHASLYKGLHALLSAPKSRRDLLLMQRHPQSDASVSLKGSYGDFDSLMLRVKQARDLFLIIGPPGTGKTSFGMLNTLKEELLEPDSSVLIASYTNRAVDEICSKLVDENIDFIRIGSRWGCSDAYTGHLLGEKVNGVSKLDDLRALVSNTRVFVGTTTAFNSNPQIFALKHFSLAIIDEASQILEPHLMGLWSAMHESRPAIRKFVLIGDHKQLPAVVQQSKPMSAVSNPSLREIGVTDCRLSLFERFLAFYADDPSVTYMLCRQGRMHHDIAEFPNKFFYDGKLTEVPLKHQLSVIERSDSVLSRRVAFLPVAAPSNSPSDKVNIAEAQVIAHLVHEIYESDPEHFDSSLTVGVIVPYRNQIATVRNMIDRFNIPQLHDITIDTVERYQGSQRQCIIYGFTVQKHYQLSFLTDNRFVDRSSGALIDRKLNVAMTRAQEHLFIVGNPAILSTDPLFAALIDFAV